MTLLVWPSVYVVRLGDDHYLAEGRSLYIQTNGSPTLVGASVALNVDTPTPYTKAMVVVDTYSTYCELTATNIADLPVGSYTYQVIATLASGHKHTLAVGKFVVKGAYTP